MEIRPFVVTLLILPCVACANETADGSTNTISGPARVTGTFYGEAVAGQWVATPEQAVDGSRNDLIMSPQATQAAISAALPKGAVVLFVGSTPPTGWSLIKDTAINVPDGFVAAVKE